MKNVKHLEKDQKFVLSLSESDPSVCGELLYERVDKTHLDFYHTEVPREYRGQGLGGVLAQAALDYVKQKNLTVTLSCTFLEKYGRENLSREYLDRHVKPGAGCL